MNKSLIIASALALGSSSVAMADSFSFGAKASVSIRTPATRVVVRDHRTPTYQTPAYPAPQYTSTYNSTRYSTDNQWTRRQPQPAIPAGLDCRNWDPTVDAGNVCADFFSSGYNAYAPRMRGGWTLLGVRESAVADNQFVTVADGRSFGRLQIRAEQGSPVITKVAVRFMDNSVQVINLGGYLSGSTVLQLNHRAVNQIVVYTAAGSRGTYSIAAL